MPYLDQPDGRLRYETGGDGPPVLLIQGVGVSGEAWRPQAEGWSGRFGMLWYDNRGLGGSVPCRGPITIEAMARDGLALMDAVGWESAHVVGHSMGGVIAQQLALDAPRRVRSLGLLCTFARGRDGARLTPWVLWMTLRTRIGTRASRRAAFVEMLISAKHRRSADGEALARRLGALVGRDLADQPAVLMRQVRALAAHDVSARLGRLGSIPTLVLSATEDRIAPPRYGRALAAAIPGAHFEEIPEAAHAVTIEQADSVNARLATFLESAERRWSDAATGGGG